MKRSQIKRSQQPLKRTPLKRQNSSKAKEKQENRRIQKIEDNLFYEDIWKSRGHRCQLTENYLGEEIMVIFFHHLLSKEQYPQFRHKKWNILQCQGKLHHQIEMNPHLLPEELYDKFIVFLNHAKKMANLD